MKLCCEVLNYCGSAPCIIAHIKCLWQAAYSAELHHTWFLYWVTGKSDATILMDFSALEPTSLRDQCCQNEFESGRHSRHASGAKHQTFFCHAPPLFGFTSTISRFDERFRDGQYSLVSFLFAVLLTVPLSPPCPAICISWGHISPCPVESAPLFLAVCRKRQQNSG